MTPDQLSAIRARLVWLEENGGIGLPFAEARALLDEVERLRVERDDLLAWSQRFADLVGVDGSTEAGRDEAFAKLYDAAKASGKLVKE